MSGNLIKKLVLVTGIALGVATVGVAARRLILSRFDVGSDLDAGADELDENSDGIDLDVIFVEDNDEDESDDNTADESEDDQPED